MPDNGHDEVPAPFLECLEAVYRLAPDGTAVSLDALAKRTGLTKALLTERVLGLQGVGFVDRVAAERLALTAEGRRRAVGLIRTHRLLERFLVDLLELPWAEVHEEAARLTPILSDRVGDRLAKLLGDPAACPHGNPIPSADGVLRAEHAVPLHRLARGQAATIVRIEPEDGELLKHLATLGLLPRTPIEVEEVSPFGGPVLVRVGTSRYALGRKVAAKIFVTET